MLPCLGADWLLMPSSSIKASFGKHVTAAVDGKKSVAMQVFFFKATIEKQVRIRLFQDWVDGCVWPQWWFVKHTPQMALPWKPAIAYLQLQTHSHLDGSKVQTLTERLQMMTTLWWDGFLAKLVLSCAGILLHPVQSCFDWSEASLAALLTVVGAF